MKKVKKETKSLRNDMDIVKVELKNTNFKLNTAIEKIDATSEKLHMTINTNMAQILKSQAILNGLLYKNDIEHKQFDKRIKRLEDDDDCEFA